MKGTVFVVVLVLILISCQSSLEENNQQRIDSTNIKTVDSTNIKTETKTETYSSEWILNDLLNYKDENALKEKFGKKNVITDTLWGPEATFEIGTKLFPGTVNEVEISWHDEEKKANIRCVSTNLYNYKDGSYPQWKTREGVYIGMPLEELVKINGKPIKFTGFGFDYEGCVTSFEKGTLEGKVFIELTYTANISEKDYLEIIGDKVISTENINLSKYKFKVASMSVCSY